MSSQFFFISCKCFLSASSTSDFDSPGVIYLLWNEDWRQLSLNANGMFVWNCQIKLNWTAQINRNNIGWNKHITVQITLDQGKNMKKKNSFLLFGVSIIVFETLCSHLALKILNFNSLLEVLEVMLQIEFKFSLHIMRLYFYLQCLINLIILSSNVSGCLWKAGSVKNSQCDENSKHDKCIYLKWENNHYFHCCWTNLANQLLWMQC